MDEDMKASLESGDMKASKEYESLESGLLTDDNVLLTMCDESIESQEALPEKDNSSMLGYQLVDKTKADSVLNYRLDDKTILSYRLIDKAKNEQQLEVKTEPAYLKYAYDQASPRSVPRPIAPKFPSNNSGNGRIVIESYKKRDDKRRATHNEVERRRRDKINYWIFQLKELIPESTGATSPNDSRYKATATDSKSQILIRACEYIKEMQDELKSLRECLNENDKLRLSNQQLQLQMNQLKTFISQPKGHVCETPAENQRGCKK